MAIELCQRFAGMLALLDHLLKLEPRSQAKSTCRVAYEDFSVSVAEGLHFWRVDPERGQGDPSLPSS